MSTSLAELWENQADVRRRAMNYMIDFWNAKQLSLIFWGLFCLVAFKVWIMLLPSETFNHEVDTGASKRISRGTIDLNESLMLPIFQQLGTRVGVDLLYFHLEALYKLMKIPVDRFLPKNFHRLFSMDPDPQNSY